MTTYLGSMCGWKWRGCCYYADDIFPYGFCESCWIKHGKPRAMDMSKYPRAKEMLENGGEC